MHSYFQKIGARERTRTSTTLRSLAPEASASAISATRARVSGSELQQRRSHPYDEAFSFCPAHSPLSTRGTFQRGSRMPEGNSTSSWSALICFSLLALPLYFGGPGAPLARG